MTKHRMTLLLLTLLAFLILPGCMEDNRQVYQNDAYGIELRYPPEWGLGDMAANPPAIFFTLSREPLYFNEGITESIILVGGFKPAMKDYVDNYLQNYRREGQVTSKTTETIRGQQVQRVEFEIVSGTEKQGKGVYYNFMLPDRSLFLLLHYMDGYEEDVAILDQIVRSIRLD